MATLIGGFDGEYVDIETASDAELTDLVNHYTAYLAGDVYWAERPHMEQNLDLVVDEIAARTHDRQEMSA